MDWLPCILTVLVTLLALCYLGSRSLVRPQNFPPGPPALPVIGNIHQFGKKPHKTMLKWKEKYGDVYSVYAGHRPMVVLSDFETVCKVYADEVVTGRDNESAVRCDADHMKGIGLIFSEGELWKTHRRFALQTLRDLGMGKNWLEESIITEVEGLCKTLRETNQTPCNPKVLVDNSVSNIICALTFGKTYSRTDRKFSRLTGLLPQILGAMAWDNLVMTFPFVMWFPNFIHTKVMLARKNVKDLMSFLREQVAEHDKVVNEHEDVQDYVYVYQTLAEKENSYLSKQDMKESFDERQLVGSLFDLFGAGTETTSTTILWAFLFMLEYPDVMLKVQEEIDTHVDREKTLTNADRALLPYTEAVILEVQRAASLVPLGVPHINHEDIKIDGYTIPKGTLIVANLFSIHRDERWWNNPLQFDPTRFLDADMKLTSPDGFAPFSVGNYDLTDIGKRACLGEALAKMELFLFIANLLRCFTLKLPSGKTASLEDYTSSIVSSPLPFDIIFVPRTQDI